MPKRADSDEYYIIDLCDEVIGLTALRGARFPFLVGDTGRRLPVDAYYESLQLVIEYNELQHTEAVPIFDKRQTVSGMPRGEQRRRYDEVRRIRLPENGIRLVIFSVFDFKVRNRKRIARNRCSDLSVIRERLRV